MPFLKALAQRKTQTTSSRIWTQLADCISYNNKPYSEYASLQWYLEDLSGNLNSWPVQFRWIHLHNDEFDSRRSYVGHWVGRNCTTYESIPQMKNKKEAKTNSETTHVCPFLKFLLELMPFPTIIITDARRKFLSYSIQWLACFADYASPMINFSSRGWPVCLSHHSFLEYWVPLPSVKKILKPLVLASQNKSTLKNISLSTDFWAY